MTRHAYPAIGGGTLPEELVPGAARAFSIFTGQTEHDPHRVGFWTVEVTAEGLTLARAEVPKGQEETGHASWAELHAMLGAREALGEDLEHLRHEIAEEEASLVRLRVEARRLRTLVDARRRMLDGSAPREAPGIVALRPRAEDTDAR